MASGGENTLRVVLLGKLGAGKSSLGNTLTGITKKEDLFKVGVGLMSERTEQRSKWNKGVHDGITIEVTVTPGLCDTLLPPDLIYKEVAKSVAVAQPGPHILILTLRCDRRFTKEELDAYRTIKKMFSDEMNRFMILVFNGLDVYEDQKTLEGQRQELQKQITDFGPELDEIMSEANGRFFGMNNKASPADKEKQVRDLVQMMKKLVMDNENHYYTTPVTTKIKKEVDVLVDECAKEKNISKVEATDQVKRDIVEERVQPSFFQKVGGMISSAASAVVDACSVM